MRDRIRYYSRQLLRARLFGVSVQTIWIMLSIDQLLRDNRGDVDPGNLLERTYEQINEADSFQVWVRNTLLGGTIGALAYALISGITSIGSMITAPFRAVANGLSRFIEGTFFSGVDVIDAGGQTAAGAFLEGFSAWLGPLAFPASVLTVIIAIYILVRAFRYISPADWARQVWRRR